MHTIHTPLAGAFDRLFDQLLATLEEERTLKSTDYSFTELVDVKDRLHSIRAELAQLRRHLHGDLRNGD